VARGLAPPVWRWLSNTPTGWKRPYWVVANHPERGAIWLETRGGSDQLCALVRYHETELPSEWSSEPDLVRWHTQLAAADAVH